MKMLAELNEKGFDSDKAYIIHFVRGVNLVCSIVVVVIGKLII